MLFLVPSFIPALVQAFPLVYLFCYFCAGALRKHPLAFYLPWALVVVFVSWGELLAAFGLDSLAFVADYNAWLSSTRDAYPVLDTVLNLFTSSVVGVSFYLIVMFVGVCEKTKTVKRFYSIRSEMSVLGGIIIMGHVCRVLSFVTAFANPMVVQMYGRPAGDFMFIAGVLIGPLLTIAFVIPWIASFKAVRRRMEPATWRKVQKLAYPFTIFMLAQGLFLALGHALYLYPFDGMRLFETLYQGGATFMSDFAGYVASAWIYAALLAAYPVLRLRHGRKAKPQDLTGKTLHEIGSEQA